MLVSTRVDSGTKDKAFECCADLVGPSSSGSFSESTDHGRREVDFIQEPGEKTSATPKKDFRHEKAMLCVFWSARGVVHWELLEQGQDVNSEVYCQQSERVNRQLHRRRHGRVVFLDDNAKLHRSRLTNAKVTDLGWDRLDHPPYSPDLAPSDFHLFRLLQHFLKGKRLENIDEMREVLQEFFDSKGADFYRRGIEKLSEKWQEVIDVDGNYFD